MPDLPTVVADVAGSAGAVIVAVNGSFQIKNGAVTDSSMPVSSIAIGNGTVNYNGPAGVVSGNLTDGGSN